MEFCDDCGGMLVSKSGEMECRSCGKKQEVSSSDYQITDEKEEDPMDGLNVSSEDEQETTRPTCDKDCPSCGSEQVHEWWMEQTRASDEPPTRFYECTKCGNVHKEYD
jgi:DNA-directed RNA polymerase subunit M